MDYLMLVFPVAVIGVLGWLLWRVQVEQAAREAERRRRAFARTVKFTIDVDISGFIRAMEEAAAALAAMYPAIRHAVDEYGHLKVTLGRDEETGE